MNICKWYFYTDYFETECSNSITDNDYGNIQPTYCPYCGNEIEIDNA